MGFHVFLQILRSFKVLLTKIAFVGLQRNMDSNVRGNVVTLYSYDTAIFPTAGEREVVCAFSTHMYFAKMII